MVLLRQLVDTIQAMDMDHRSLLSRQADIRLVTFVRTRLNRWLVVTSAMHTGGKRKAAMSFPKLVMCGPGRCVLSSRHVQTERQC